MKANLVVILAAICFCCISLLSNVHAAPESSSEQKILRRVIKSTPTATNLARIKLVHVRSTPSGLQERGKVTEISGKEAATFGMRNNQTSTSDISVAQQAANTKTISYEATPAPAIKAAAASTTTTSAPSTTSTTTTTTSTTTPASNPTTARPAAPSAGKPASERQVAASSPEVELLQNSPSWQTMTAVEAPAAMLIAAGARKSSVSSSQQSDLSVAASSRQLINTNNQLIADETSGDVLRSVKGGQVRQSSFSTGETFARLRQQHSKTNHNQQQQQHQQLQQQSFFYPQSAPQQLRVSKTSESTKTSQNHWYQPVPAPTTSTTTPRPAPIIEQQRYEQQAEQYVEQQAEFTAPPGEAEPFAFDFKTQDQSGNGQYRKEQSDKNGVVKGSYGYTDANGIYRHVEYIADQNGFRANIKSNEPGLIGETQPASIELARGNGANNVESPSTNSRLIAANYPTNNDNNNNNGAYDSSADNNGDWSAPTSNSNNEHSSSSAEFAAIASPDFESSHKPESIRSRRHFRN